MYRYQETNTYFAQVADDIKDLAQVELETLGATNIRLVYRGIHFKASQQNLYSINYNSSLINRILAPLLHFDCHSDKYLYKRAREIPWKDFLYKSDTFAVNATVTHSTINHSKFAALRLKDAIVDYFRDNTGKRPAIDTKNPDVWFNLHIENNRATISLDTSGGALHRRGYRQKGGPAPMIETLAAAIIQLSEWDGKTSLYDPFCGSGTLLCEAYLKASRTPPGILRKNFGFEHLPDFDTLLWDQVKSTSRQKIIPISNGLITGSDIDQQIVETARLNCSAITPRNNIKILRQDTFDIKNINGKMIVCNPPYGIRLEKTTDLSNFYQHLGDFLKRRCNGSTAFIYFGERRYLKNIGLRSTWKKALFNGGLDGRLAKFELY